MDKSISWIRNNQAKAAAIGVLLAALAYTQLSKPRTYEDCLLQVVKDAKSDDSAIIGRKACRAKFPFQIPEFDINKPFEVYRDGVWEKVYPNGNVSRNGVLERNVYPGGKAFIDPFVIHRQNGHEYNFLED